MRLEILLILSLIVLGGLIYYKDGGVVPDLGNFSFFNSATSTKEKEAAPERTSFFSKPKATVSEPPQSLSSKEVEEKVDEVYAGLDALQENLRESKLYLPSSSFAGMVSLTASQAKSTDPDKEYVTITASANNTNSINITGWRLESYVTKSKATIPQGASLLNGYNSKTEEAILLKPGERAYLTTGETPLRVSFRENECTGYLVEYGSFSPSLQKSCPLPGDEMLQFASISPNDNECFEFVEDIKRCETISSEELDKADLSGNCNSFIKHVLDYDGCVNKHSDDPTFYDTGVWRIYLDKEGELWRSTREIIRLLDADGNVVDVLEY